MEVIYLRVLKYETSRKTKESWIRTILDGGEIQKPFKYLWCTGIQKVYCAFTSILLVYMRVYLFTSNPTDVTQVSAITIVIRLIFIRARLEGNPLFYQKILISGTFSLGYFNQMIGYATFIFMHFPMNVLYTDHSIVI